MPREYKMYINGEWVDALDRAMYDDYNPYTGEAFARVPSGKRGDAKRAIEAAAAAFPAWSNTLPAERQALFLKATDILQKKQNEIVTILAEETGSTFGFAMFQTTYHGGIKKYQWVAQPLAISCPSPVLTSLDGKPVSVTLTPTVTGGVTPISTTCQSGPLCIAAQSAMRYSSSATPAIPPASPRCSPGTESAP